ncbi:39S ribosomal protein L37, mitochondrial [Cricetulus griseus]|uniref:Large ribosomal subunit protein mL37 n=1 Tax=Cricetulus griseus TaxID=10029 RepID=A0A3L7I6M7_CRIGR|nr:39S ribosomal protein L37, mitochondrial [Cricetulus griseus]XP_027258161.1 39S ribosomal protein L37, mitochondrial [Cricetulus griseus]
MALASGPAWRALAGSGRLGLGGCGAPKRGAYEWGVRSTRKPEPRPLDRVYEIPGLEPITYEGKMHFVPGLARPIFPPWDRGWKDPRYHRTAPIPEQPLYKEQPCYIFHRRCRLLEGMKQALWLTKTKLIEGLPKKVLSLVDDPRNHIENQEERVLNIISHARLWHSPEDIPKRETYCPVIVNSLIQLCKSQIFKHPSLARRMSAQNYSLATTWNRESLLLQVRGSNGTILSTKDPLPTIASREEVEATKSHVLETFYPISPIIDLQECHVYDVKDDTGFREDYPYPHLHTLYFLENANLRPHRFPPEQLRAKMLLFAFGNALARARLLYGNATKVLEQPIVVQSVGTDGRVFQFLVLQLNTTDLASSEGIKNLVWIDSDQLLYQHFWCRPVIKKKVMVEPVGPVDFQPETFRKFLALYLHGAV